VGPYGRNAAREKAVDSKVMWNGIACEAQNIRDARCRLIGEETQKHSAKGTHTGHVELDVNILRSGLCVRFEHRLIHPPFWALDESPLEAPQRCRDGNRGTGAGIIDERCGHGGAADVYAEFLGLDEWDEVGYGMRLIDDGADRILGSFSQVRSSQKHCRLTSMVA
jgi:hypothetical protein